MNKFQKAYGPWAIVTGASAGIGAEFAEQLAGRGLNLVLVARRADLLETLENDLKASHKIDVRTVPLDLCARDFLATLHEATHDIDVGLLVNNAGTGIMGSFLENDLDAELGVLALNTRAPLILSHTFGKRMAARGGGGIIMVSSMVALTGVPRFAHYSATKAYDMVLGESLRYELKSSGVDVVTLMPGFTKSEYTSKLDLSRVPMPLASTDAVVRKALNKLGHGSKAIPGLMNKIMYATMPLMGRNVNTSVMGSLMGRMSMKA